MPRPDEGGIEAGLGRAAQPPTPTSSASNSSSRLQQPSPRSGSSCSAAELRQLEWDSSFDFTARYQPSRADGEPTERSEPRVAPGPPLTATQQAQTVSAPAAVFAETEVNLVVASADSSRSDRTGSYGDHTAPSAAASRSYTETATAPSVPSLHYLDSAESDELIRRWRQDRKDFYQLAYLRRGDSDVLSPADDSGFSSSVLTQRHVSEQQVQVFTVSAVKTTPSAVPAASAAAKLGPAQGDSAPVAAGAATPPTQQEQVTVLVPPRDEPPSSAASHQTVTAGNTAGCDTATNIPIYSGCSGPQPHSGSSSVVPAPSPEMHVRKSLVNREIESGSLPRLRSVSASRSPDPCQPPLRCDETPPPGSPERSGAESDEGDGDGDRDWAGDTDRGRNMDRNRGGYEDDGDEYRDREEYEDEQRPGTLGTAERQWSRKDAGPTRGYSGSFRRSVDEAQLPLVRDTIRDYEVRSRSVSRERVPIPRPEPRPEMVTRLTLELETDREPGAEPGAELGAEPELGAERDDQGIRRPADPTEPTDPDPYHPGQWRQQHEPAPRRPHARSRIPIRRPTPDTPLTLDGDGALEGGRAVVRRLQHTHTQTDEFAHVSSLLQLDLFPCQRDAPGRGHADT
ncbi:hypothetical protein FJT64_020228 [Amphibalanus amphitrite]|uniref:Uncharacterized protein n=1 Tax=Amphibalanus amphitrite TaxID=1232801 RepID=A0A6A4WMM7_AMPAM|nr:hypothetical protein FJT64_020228 [Amphibalanus amphitrite]